MNLQQRDRGRTLEFSSLASSEAEQQRRTIALVDPQATGHHPLYFSAFAEELAGLGFEVVGICPDAEAIRLPMAGRLIGPSGNSFFEWAPPQFSFRPRRLSVPLGTHAAHWWLSRRLASLERQMGRKIDLVFFACLYDRFLTLHSSSFAWDWVGLYLQVSGFRIPDEQAVHPLSRFNLVKRSKGRLKGLSVLDEDAIEFVQRISGCLNVQRFPDFSDTRVNPNSLVAEQLNRRASGRKVIGVAGHLVPSKGIATLAEAAIAMAAEHPNVLLAFVGEFAWESFDEGSRETLRRAFALPNVFTHLERIPSEFEFNAVLNEFDVIYAGYYDFPHSSNMPAKAAGLGKPLIVSSGYLLAERTARYLLGKVIPERDVDALRKAILELIDSQACLPNSEGCHEYLSLHSRQSLRESLRSLLTPIWQQAGVPIKV
ncbi:MAG TPA: hypothetical protein DDZ51_31210 [Planctomycetaceae bacterium]|nr:hypothetical protein [Planctomycetaceae bacterium]